MEKWADDVIRIANDASGDYVDRIGRDGEVERVVDPETVQRSKLRIDTRMRLMSKFAAKRFGDKLDLTLTGAVEVSSLSDAELEARTRARLVALGVQVTAPLLLPMPGAVPAPAAAPPPVSTVSGPRPPGPDGKRANWRMPRPGGGGAARRTGGLNYAPRPPVTQPRSPACSALVAERVSLDAPVG